MKYSLMSLTLGNLIKVTKPSFLQVSMAKRMGLAVEDCVYVGDSEVDIETARNAGMTCISVSWGFRDEEMLLSSGASILVRTPGELSERILQ